MPASARPTYWASASLLQAGSRKTASLAGVHSEAPAHFPNDVVIATRPPSAEMLSTEPRVPIVFVVSAGPAVVAAGTRASAAASAAAAVIEISRTAGPPPARRRWGR